MSQNLRYRLDGSEHQRLGFVLTLRRMFPSEQVPPKPTKPLSPPSLQVHLKASILAGRTGIMPGWRDALGGDTGVDETLAYVRSLSGGTVDAAKAAAGKEKYNAVCAACHAADGAGNPALGAPSLADDVWLYGGSDSDVRHSIAEGREGRMPAHGEFFGEARVHVLAAWVWSLSQR